MDRLFALRKRVAALRKRVAVVRYQLDFRGQAGSALYVACAAQKVHLDAPQYESNRNRLWGDAGAALAGCPAPLLAAG